jgi:hypothetical protein
MNTKTKQDQKKNRRQKVREPQGSKKRTRNSSMLQEHELPELRLTR